MDYSQLFDNKAITKFLFLYFQHKIKAKHKNIIFIKILLMADKSFPDNEKWHLMHKLSFRFFFIYFILHIAPWTWLDGIIPGMDYLTGYYRSGIYWLVNYGNQLIFHFPDTSVVNNGSGDTSFNWEEVFTYLIVAFAGMVIWSIVDRKRAHYEKASYWLNTFLRYFLIMMCMSYGINKLFALQMPFPNLSQLATPLGDFLPMRLSWMFIGYSAPYEIFSGAMEVLAGLLLLNRKTITLGLFTATAVFINIMVLNFCYDIPVKIFSAHLVIFCCYLLTTDAKRLFQFFVLNRSVAANTLYQIHFQKKWMRISSLVLKISFVGLYVILPFFTTKNYAESFNKPAAIEPIIPGLYDVKVFVVNKDTIPGIHTDTLRWKDIVFEKNGTGSVGSTDTSFRQRYRRGYFTFDTDTTRLFLGMKTKGDSNYLFSFYYYMPDSNTIYLQGKNRKDSLYMELRRSKRHFQLAEKQFHWISEANR